MLLPLTTRRQYGSPVMLVSETWLEDAVWGGALLGGGGGGSIAEGLTLGHTVFSVGRPVLIHPGDREEDGLIASCSVARAPQASHPFHRPGHHVRAVELLREHLSGELIGLIPEGMGGRGVIDGWYQSAVLGLPVFDLPADGRAHPIALQGTMGLTSDDAYISWQACAGGDPDRNEYVEQYVSASLEIADKLTRRAAAQAGGLVSVARNPISLSRAIAGGVPGGIRQAMETGRIYRDQLGNGVEQAAAALAEHLGGNLQGEARVTEHREGYSSGMDTAVIECPPYRLTAAGTLLTIEQDGRLLARFPDLVIAVDALNGMPLVVEEMTDGRDLLLLTVPWTMLSLGAGVTDPRLLSTLEEITGRSMTLS